MPLRHDSEGCFVLVVEDDYSIRSAIRDMLELEGFQVCAVENGQEALDFLDRHTDQPCLILLDLMMPVMDGWSFMEVAQERLTAANIPLMIVSAVTDKRRLPDGVPYLSKPIDIDALIDRVQLHCR